MQLERFDFNKIQVRTFMANTNEPLFVANDVCKALELADTEVALRKLEDDEKQIRKIYASGQNRNMLMVNESGLYNLIFRSNKPEARRFRKWVTSEVLPSIRRHGCYIPLQAETEGRFKGLMPITVNGYKFFCYSEVLRRLNYSTNSGSASKRKQKYTRHFFSLYGRNFITSHLAEHLRKQKRMLDIGRRLQAELPFIELTSQKV